jgi:two-component system chemotaxis sensor kinase CheA
VTLVFDATDADLVLFLAEAAEQLDLLGRGLLQIERDMGDADLIQAVFRAAHTLKGAAATIGHVRMARLTHAMEGVLDAIRTGTLKPGSSVIDCLLACVDALNILNEEVRTREQCQLAVDVLVERLQEIAAGTAADGEPAEDRRRADLGPETRGASIEEQLVVAGSRLTTAASMVKVDTGRLDAMMGLVGELAVEAGQMQRALGDLAARLGDDATFEPLAETTRHVRRLTDDLRDQVMRSRLLPAETLFNRFPRMVRDLARKGGKLVRLETTGGETGLDRSVIDEIGDPLLHLLRNAVDHGVEPPDERSAAGKPAEATVRLSARHEEGRVVIDVSDDGRGIDPDRIRATAIRKGMLDAARAAGESDAEAINLIFAPGFSAADRVTDVSGRGVGLDIVRTNVAKVNGELSVRTARGAGTTFTIAVPLTLAVIRALLVRVDDVVYALPLASVEEALRVESAAIRAVDGRAVTTVRGAPLPLVRLGDVFDAGGSPAGHDSAPTRYVVAVHGDGTRLGLVVDGVVGEQEVVITSIGGGVLGGVEGIVGATILSDGRVALIVDVPGLVERLAGEGHAGSAAA